MPTVPILMMPIPVGNPMRIRVTFLDVGQQPFDPSSGIRIFVQKPNVTAANATSYVYPTDLIRESVGVYSVVAEADTRGDWLAWGTGKLVDGKDVTTAKVLQKVE